MSVVPVFDFPVETKAFVEHGLWGGKRQFGKCASIGFANEVEGLVAGLVYHNYNPDAGVVELSAYASRRDWATRTIIRLMLEYPFVQLGVRVLVARIGERNARARRIWRALGATEHTIPEVHGPGEAEVVAVLTREAWRHGKFCEKEPNLE